MRLLTAIVLLALGVALLGACKSTPSVQAGPEPGAAWAHNYNIIFPGPDGCTCFTAPLPCPAAPPSVPCPPKPPAKKPCPEPVAYADPGDPDGDAGEIVLTGLPGGTLPGPGPGLGGGDAAPDVREMTVAPNVRAGLALLVVWLAAVLLMMRMRRTAGAVVMLAVVPLLVGCAAPNVAEMMGLATPGDVNQLRDDVNAQFDSKESAVSEAIGMGLSAEEALTRGSDARRATMEKQEPLPAGSAGFGEWWHWVLTFLGGPPAVAAALAGTKRVAGMANGKPKAPDAPAAT